MHIPQMLQQFSEPLCIFGLSSADYGILSPATEIAGSAGSGQCRLLMSRCGLKVVSKTPSRHADVIQDKSVS